MNNLIYFGESLRVLNSQQCLKGESLDFGNYLKLTSFDRQSLLNIIDLFFVTQIFDFHG